MRAVSRPVLAAAIGCLLAWQAGAEAGEIKGKVDVKRRSSGYNPGKAYGHGGAFEKPEPKPEFTEAQNVVIYVEMKDSTLFTRSDTRPKLIQRAKTFIPPVLPVLLGTTVDFPNEDAIYHNVFSYSRPKRFDLGRYPTGSSRSVTFDKPGLVKVACEIHKDMVAYILVLETPYFAVPGRDGQFAMPDLPSGHCRVHVWHPDLPAQVVEVFIPKMGALELNFIL